MSLFKITPIKTKLEFCSPFCESSQFNNLLFCNKFSLENSIFEVLKFEFGFGKPKMHVNNEFIVHLNNKFSVPRRTV